MRNLIAILTLAAAMTVSAADNTAKFIDRFTASTVGALKTADLDGESQWGAGIDIGYKVNPFVSLHVVNLSFEGAGQTTTQGKKSGTVTTGEDDWGGLLVDETDVYVKAKINRFSNESVTLYAMGGGQYEWNERAFGIGVGAGLSYNFSKHVSLSADYTVRAWFSELEGGQELDGLARAHLDFSF